jgi:ATP-dependent Clp protease protease subunit
MKKTWEFKNIANDPKTGELFLYGEIASSTWFGDEVTPIQFKKDLDSLGDIKTLNIYINSPGGDVFAADAMYNIVKRHGAYKNVYIDGMAASAAHYFSMVGDTIYVYSNSMGMIHKPGLVLIGAYNSTEMRKYADTLDKVQESVIPIYTQRTKLNEQEIIELMDAETWLTADDEVTFGFADEILEGKQIAASLKAGHLIMNGQEFDLDRFKTKPKLDGIPEEPKNEEPDADRLFIYQKQIALKNKKYKYQEDKE